MILKKTDSALPYNILYTLLITRKIDQLVKDFKFLDKFSVIVDASSSEFELLCCQGFFSSNALTVKWAFWENPFDLHSQSSIMRITKNDVIRTVFEGLWLSSRQIYKRNEKTECSKKKQLSERMNPLFATEQSATSQKSKHGVSIN